MTIEQKVKELQNDNFIRGIKKEKKKEKEKKDEHTVTGPQSQYAAKEKPRFNNQEGLLGT